MKGGSQGSRFALLLNRLFGLGDQITPADVAPELLPTFDIGSDRMEYRAPRGEYTWTFQANKAAVVGEQSFVGVSNPAGTGRCIIVESAILITAQDFLRALRRGSPATPTLAAASSDGRTPRATVPIGFTGSEAVLGTTDGHLPLAANTQVRVDVVLPPGTDWRLIGTAANTAVPVITFKGYIRPCTPEEMAIGA